MFVGSRLNFLCDSSDVMWSISLEFVMNSYVLFWIFSMLLIWYLFSFSIVLLLDKILDCSAHYSELPLFIPLIHSVLRTISFSHPPSAATCESKYLKQLYCLVFVILTHIHLTHIYINRAPHILSLTHIYSQLSASFFTQTLLKQLSLLLPDVLFTSIDKYTFHVII